MDNLYNAASLLPYAYAVALDYTEGPIQLPEGYRLVTPLFGNDLQIVIDQAEAFREPGFVFFGFVVEETATGRNIAVFRGTQTVFEAVQDARFVKVPNPFEVNAGMVESGFAAVASSIKDQPNAGGNPFRAVVGALPQAKPLVIVGHSLGAAIATLMSYRAKQLFPGFTLDVVLVASPRVGDATFAARYDAMLGSRTVRLSVTADIVPQVPFPFMGFQHVVDGKEILLAPRNIVKPSIPCWHSATTYLNLWARQLAITPPALGDCGAAGAESLRIS